LIAGAIANCAFVLGPLLGVALDPLLTFVSELSSTGQPFGSFFAATDLITGSLIAAGVILGWNEVAATVLLRIAQVSALVFAVCTGADAFLPLDCVPSIDAACRAAESLGAVSTHHRLHSVTAVAESVAIIVMSLSMAFGTWRIPGWRSVSRLALAAAVTQVALNMGISAMWLSSNVGVGALQRLSVVVFSTTIAMIGWGLITRHRLH
jgi:hypothetical protein